MFQVLAFLCIVSSINSFLHTSKLSSRAFLRPLNENFKPDDMTVSSQFFYSNYYNKFTFILIFNCNYIKFFNIGNF